MCGGVRLTGPHPAVPRERGNHVLSLRLRLADLETPNWQWANGRWACGESWIAPANVSALVAILNNDDPQRVTLTVREFKGEEAEFAAVVITLARSGSQRACSALLRCISWWSATCCTRRGTSPTCTSTYGPTGSYRAR